jgi:purine-binding chemotaxis protein CheW
MEKYILFRLGPEVFGVHISRVVEILKAPAPSPLPEVPDYISGVITLRGEVIPVVDMRKRLSVEPAPAKERAVIIRSGKEKIGLLVDEVLEIKGFTEKDASPLPELFRGVKTEYFKAIARTEGGHVAILLDMDRILSSDEQILLAGAAGTGSQANQQNA